MTLMISYLKKFCIECDELRSTCRKNNLFEIFILVFYLLSYSFPNLFINKISLYFILSSYVSLFHHWSSNPRSLKWISDKSFIAWSKIDHLELCHRTQHVNFFSLINYKHLQVARIRIIFEYVNKKYLWKKKIKKGKKKPVVIEKWE